MEEITVKLSRNEAETLQSMLEVLVDGTGTYQMLRLESIVKTHIDLLDKYSAAIGREREEKAWN